MPCWMSSAAWLVITYEMLQLSAVDLPRLPTACRMLTDAQGYVQPPSHSIPDSYIAMALSPSEASPQRLFMHFTILFIFCILPRQSTAHPKRLSK